VRAANRGSALSDVLIAAALFALLAAFLAYFLDQARRPPYTVLCASTAFTN
jgi:hypothetical protein